MEQRIGAVEGRFERIWTIAMGQNESRMVGGSECVGYGMPT